MKRDGFTVVDLFAGCGGLSYGLQSTGRLRIIAAIDLFSDALETHALNHTGVELISEDLRYFSESRVRSLGTLARSIDVIVGGPPCEGFSQNKRREFIDERGERRFGRNLSFVSDPRNMLFREYLRFVQILLPKIVLIENVPQLLTHTNGKVRDEILICLRKLGYLAQARTLLASDYGVPQNRRRAFILGVREDVHRQVGFVSWPVKTHGVAFDEGNDLGLPALHKVVTVKDAIADLPSATATIREQAYRRLPRSEYALEMRRNSVSVTWHVARTPGPRILARLNALSPGMRLDDIPERLRTRSYYFNAYGRLAWDQPAKTITKSCNYLGSGCFGHPELDRGITMREAARLQSFPDSFHFAGAAEPSIAKQIGGAVPPLLARALGNAIVEHLLRLKKGDLDVA